MSTLLGNPGERWPLSQAVDALADSAKRAGVPGLVWGVGVFYPSLNLSYGLVRSFLGMVEQATAIPIPGAGSAGALVFLFGPESLGVKDASLQRVIGLALVALPLYLLLYRLIVGLAKLSDPQSWDEEARTKPGLVEVHAGRGPLGPDTARHSPRLGAVWRAGKGLGATACGLWLVLSILLVGAMLFLLGPLVTVVRLLDLTQLSPMLVGLILPILALVLAYAAILQVLNQLALHSLAHNRRGVASALTHAWRLMRGSPAGTVRAALLDLVLFFSVLVAGHVLVGTFRLGSLGDVLVLAIYGFAGVARAGYWARTYRALGGLSAADHVPGLHA